MRRLITERIFVLLIEEYKIGLAFWPHQDIWTAGCRDHRGEYRQVQASSAFDAVEVLARRMGWLDRDGNPI